MTIPSHPIPCILHSCYLRCTRLYTAVHCCTLYTSGSMNPMEFGALGIATAAAGPDVSWYYTSIHNETWFMAQRPFHFADQLPFEGHSLNRSTSCMHRASHLGWALPYQPLWDSESCWEMHCWWIPCVLTRYWLETPFPEYELHTGLCQFPRSVPCCLELWPIIFFQQPNCCSTSTTSTNSWLYHFLYPQFCLNFSLTLLATSNETCQASHPKLSSLQESPRIMGQRCQDHPVRSASLSSEHNE